jgi:hypothetical protein
MRILDWFNLAIENVIAIVRDEQPISLAEWNRSATEFHQPSLAQGQRERHYLDRQFAPRP